MRTKLLSLSNQGAAVRDSPLKSDFTIPAGIHKYRLDALRQLPNYPCPPSCFPKESSFNPVSPSHPSICFVSRRSRVW